MEGPYEEINNQTASIWMARQGNCQLFNDQTAYS